MKHKDSHKINQKATKLLLTVCLDALALLMTNMQENSQVYIDYIATVMWASLLGTRDKETETIINAKEKLPLILAPYVSGVSLLPFQHQSYIQAWVS